MNQNGLHFQLGDPELIASIPRFPAAVQRNCVKFLSFRLSLPNPLFNPPQPGLQPSVPSAAFSTQPLLHAMPTLPQALGTRHLAAHLTLQVRSRVQQNLKQRRPKVRLPVPLQPFPQLILLLPPNTTTTPSFAIRLLVIHDHVLDVPAKQQTVDDARDAPVIDLVRPGPHLAHLGAVLLARFPVRDELHVVFERAHVDASAEVDQTEPLCSPARAAVGLVSGVPVLLVVGLRQADEAVVGFEVAVQDADGVHGFHGAQELDGEEHGDAFVEGAGRGVRGVGFGQVDEVEERSLVELGFEEVAFVDEEVQ